VCVREKERKSKRAKERASERARERKSDRPVQLLSVAELRHVCVCGSVAECCSVAELRHVCVCARENARASERAKEGASAGKRE